MFRLALVYTRSNNAEYNPIYGFLHFLADFWPCDSGPPRLRFISVVSVGSMFRSTLRTMCFSICSEVVKVSLMIRVRLVIPFVVVE